MERADEFDSNKITRWESKFCSTSSADGDDSARLVTVRPVFLVVSICSSNLSLGFEIQAKTFQIEQVVLTAKKIGARIETFGKSFAAMGLDRKRPKIFRRIA